MSSKIKDNIPDTSIKEILKTGGVILLTLLITGSVLSYVYKTIEWLNLFNLGR